MHVILCIWSLAQKDGGPPIVACEQANALAALGVSVSLLTVKAEAGASEHLPDTTKVKCVQIPGIPLPELRLTVPIFFKRQLRRYCLTEKVDIIQNHGLWTPFNHATAVVARELKIPAVWMIHGMLHPWAIRHKRWKKLPAWWLYQRRDLGVARAIHATALEEAAACRAVGCRQPIAVIPNGINCPTWQNPTNGKTPRRVLFVGRIYPVKGLMNLVHAWARLNPAGWECVIAGPDESGHQGKLQKEIARLGMSHAFHFPGSVQDGAKWSLYRSADVVVLPSLTENFGNVVPEALSCGIPVIATKGTPWSSLLTSRCGWWIEIGVEPLVYALSEVMRTTDNERHSMGERGRRLVESRFTWPKAASAMIQNFEWILRGGESPDFVLTE